MTEPPGGAGWEGQSSVSEGTRPPHFTHQDWVFLAPRVTGASLCPLPSVALGGPGVEK